MKEDNKYYTPAIEEFHVGFEYETLEGDEWITWKHHYLGDKYVEYSEINRIPSLDLIKYHLEGPFDSMRVKYLDRADIEIEGYSLSEVKYLHGKVVEHVKGATHIAYDPETHLMRIHNGLDMEENEQYFKGTIKNKNEFKKLLTQLGIK